MGNCFGSSAAADKNSGGSSNQNSDPRRVSNTNRTGSSSVTLSRTTCSSPSTFTVPSSIERSAYENPLTARTEEEILSSSNLKAFTFSELKTSTRNFRPDSLIGEGGFGCVYKGWIDEHTLAPVKPGAGIVVAVKKLKPESYQGHKEWVTEVHYLGQLHHPHLVRLIGYCSEGDDRLLVYEFMPKGSLENHLFRRGAQPISWAIRIKIAIGAARGLSFLHDAESQVIYRDVKTSNILLDSEFNAKLSDFGLAKAGPTGDRTHVSTQVMGTHGYAAPEYIATGRLTAKADVYSFGVVLLELLSGRRAVDKSKSGIEQNLVDWARPFLGDKHRVHRIMDVKLGGQYPKKAAVTVAALASQCLRNDPKLRPQMCHIMKVLEQLQDSKETPSYSREQRRTAPSPLARSPARYQQQPSPRTTARLPSPLQPQRPTALVH